LYMAFRNDYPILKSIRKKWNIFEMDW
jgi:hypothetical protein